VRLPKKSAKVNLDFEKLLVIASAIVSLVALYFAWQANLIARQQITSNVVPISSSYLWASEKAFNMVSGIGHDFECIQKLRLSNLGGAPASLVKWKANLYYHGESASLTGEQPYSLDSVHLNSEVRSFLIEFLDPDDKGNQPIEEPFPIQIPAYSTVDVRVKARFTMLHDVSFFYPPYDLYATEKLADTLVLDAAEVSLSFAAANKQEVSESPRAFCVDMR
jgi:hypothetical protein